MSTYATSRPQYLGWLSLVVSGVSAVWNMYDSTNRTEALRWTNRTVETTAALDAPAVAAAQAETDAEKAAQQEKLFKTLKVAGVIGAASMIGIILARGK